MDAKPLRIAPGLMLASLLCLFLPFAQQRLTPRSSEAEPLTPLDFVRGPTLHGLYHQTANPGPNAFATVAVLCIIAGFVIALYPGQKNQTASSILAAAAWVSLVTMPYGIDVAAQQMRFSYTIVEYQPAFYLLLCFLSLTALSALPFATLAHGLRFSISRMPRLTFRRASANG